MSDTCGYNRGQAHLFLQLVTGCAASRVHPRVKPLMPLRLPVAGHKNLTCFAHAVALTISLRCSLFTCFPSNGSMIALLTEQQDHAQDAHGLEPSGVHAATCHLSACDQVSSNSIHLRTRTLTISCYPSLWLAGISQFDPQPCFGSSSGLQLTRPSACQVCRCLHGKLLHGRHAAPAHA